MSPSLRSLRNGIKAKIYAGGPARIYGPAYRKLAEPLTPGDGPFLDLGCGSGSLVAAIAQKFPNVRVVGIDRNPAAVQDALQRLGDSSQAELAVMDGEDLRFSGESFQTVFAIQNLMHWRDPGAVLAEIHRVLRPGGTLRIYQAGGGPIPSDWLERSRLGWPSDRILRVRWKRYQPTETFLRSLPQLLASSGFSGVQQSHEGFYRRWVAEK